ncbi:major capsid protein [Pyramidobacter piscolens]|uniref:major capsid protein n=1 Tax=Pyramidobacter piscolens TaxID=638849 RepID=UPI002AAF0B2A|nr:major capsid protein [Pyramidobacter piscolens]
MSGNIDLFTLRTMIEPFEQAYSPKSYLLKTFFTRTRTFLTESVDIDLVNGSRRMAPFVRPRKMGIDFDRKGFTTRTIKPPMLGPQMPTTAEDLMKRTPGEGIYFGTKTPQQRAAEQLGRDLRDLEDSILRREEWMAAQALFLGKVHMYSKDEGIDEDVDFQLPGTAKLTGTDLWTNAASTPLEDLAEYATEMRKTSGYSPTVCIMGKKAATALLNHEGIMKYLDNRRVELGQIRPHELGDGVSYLGHLAFIGVDVDLLSYEEWFEDDQTETLTPIVPENRILLANPASRYEMLYGAVANVVDGVVSARRIPFSWVAPDGSSRYVRLNSRPLPVPVDVNASYRAEVV